MNPTQSDGLEIRTAGNEVLVHDPAGGQVHVLNEVAGRILALCDGSRPEAGIVETIVTETKADPAIVAPDVRTILERFASLGLLKTSA